MNTLASLDEQHEHHEQLNGEKDWRKADWKFKLQTDYYTLTFRFYEHVLYKAFGLKSKLES